MTIWIDGDACPKVIKELCFKTAIRKKILFKVVANTFFHCPTSNFIQFSQVSKGLDSADHFIAENIQAQDLVITSDIDLAARCLDKNAQALSPRGEIFHPNTIRQRQSMKSVHEQIREMGHAGFQASPFSDKEKQLFANALNYYLNKNA
ncbi:MAG: DUF188 domain-containing protein [Gammaproteobacteria bacterium]|nr:DUF188 domain-containing protein [Gammaproteobacteria bacterium]